MSYESGPELLRPAHRRRRPVSTWSRDHVISILSAAIALAACVVAGWQAQIASKQYMQSVEDRRKDEDQRKQERAEDRQQREQEQELAKTLREADTRRQASIFKEQIEAYRAQVRALEAQAKIAERSLAAQEALQRADLTIRNPREMAITPSTDEEMRGYSARVSYAIENLGLTPAKDVRSTISCAQYSDFDQYRRALDEPPRIVLHDGHRRGDIPPRSSVDVNEQTWFMTPAGPVCWIRTTYTDALGKAGERTSCSAPFHSLKPPAGKESVSLRMFPCTTGRSIKVE